MGDTLAVGVLRVIRPATDQVLAASARNPTPTPGTEYVLVTVSLECLDPDQVPCDISMGVNFHLTDPAGAIYEDVTESLEIPRTFQTAQRAGGRIAQGDLAFLVPVSSTDLVLEFIWPNMTGFYLGLH